MDYKSSPTCTEGTYVVFKLVSDNITRLVQYIGGTIPCTHYNFILTIVLHKEIMLHVNALSRNGRFFTLPKFYYWQCTIPQKQFFSRMVKCKESIICIHTSVYTEDNNNNYYFINYTNITIITGKRHHAQSVI